MFEDALHLPDALLEPHLLLDVFALALKELHEAVAVSITCAACSHQSFLNRRDQQAVDQFFCRAAIVEVRLYTALCLIDGRNLIPF